MAKKKETTENTIVLPDGRTIEVYFGVEIPELKRSYTKAELLADAEAVEYLLDIGSGAVNIVSDEPEEEDN